MILFLVVSIGLGKRRLFRLYLFVQTKLIDFEKTLQKSEVITS